MLKFAKFIMFVCLGVCSTILKGYVLSVLWLWFIVSTFSLPILNIPVAIGVTVIASILSHHNSNRDDLEREDAMSYIHMKSFVIPLVSLFVGYIAHLFM